MTKEAYITAVERAYRLTEQLNDISTYDHSPKGDWPLRRLLADAHPCSNLEQVFSGLRPRHFLHILGKKLIGQETLLLLDRPDDADIGADVKVLTLDNSTTRVAEIDLRSIQTIGQIASHPSNVIYTREPVSFLVNNQLLSMNEYGDCNCWIIEDVRHHSLSSFRSDSRSPCGLVRSRRVIHAGRFEELYCSDLDLGYLIIHYPDLVKSICDEIFFSMCFPSVLEQRILYFYILQMSAIDQW